MLAHKNGEINVSRYEELKKQFEKEILLPFKEDGLDIYRKEYNDMLLDKAFNSNGMVKELYLTITTVKKDYEEAKNYFRRISTELSSYFSKLGCKCSNIDANEKLRILHDVYRIGEEAFYNFDISNARKLGHSFKDYICPDSFSFKDDYFEMGDKFGRVLFLKDDANFIRDSMVSYLTDINQNMVISIDIKAIPINEAVKMLERILLGVELNITNWQRKQNANNNFSAVIPYDMDRSIKDIETRIPHDEIEIESGKADWKDVLAVYAVRVSNGNKEQVMQIDEEKRKILKEVFWDMNYLSSEIKIEKYKVKTIDSRVHVEISGNSNYQRPTASDIKHYDVETETETERRFLHVYIKQKPIEEIIQKYNFTAEQKTI